MSTQTAAVTALSTVVAANIRAEAARRGWTQAEMCRRLNMTPVTMSDRYRERTPWTLDETQKVADLMGVEVSDLCARPKGFEPLTFWLGADDTITVLEHGDLFWWWCDVAGCSEGGWDTVAYHSPEGAAGAALEHGRVVHTMAASRLSSLVAERYPLGARA